MNTKLRRPACAACAATELARLPVDAHAATLKPNSSAFDNATDVTRSLNELVGFTRVVLDPDLAETELGGEAVGPHERREAGAEVDGRVAVRPAAGRRSARSTADRPRSSPG